METSTASPPLFTKFLDLLPELRNEIYEYAFTEYEEYPTQITNGCRHNPTAIGTINTLDRPAICKALLFANRQIHSEALGLYKAAYRNHIKNTTFTVIAKHKSRRSVRKALKSHYLTEETLMHANKIVLEFWCKYCGIKQIELTKQTPTEENDWNDWNASFSTPVGPVDPRPAMRGSCPEAWRRHEKLKEASWRTTGQRGEGLLKMEIAALLSSGVGLNVSPGSLGIRASIGYAFAFVKALF